MKHRPNSVTTYIAAASPKARPMLRQLRSTIHQAAPMAEEKLSYGMPYYGYRGRLAYFAAFGNHVSYFVMGGAIRKKFTKQLAPYKTGEATLQFPLGTKIPVGLIKRLVQARLRELSARTEQTVER